MYVITGPVFEGEKVERINGRVFIPTQVFKAVVNPATNEGAAWLAPNDDSGEYQVVSIAELEKKIGITLFPALPDAAKQRTMSLPEPRVRSRKNR